MSSIALVVTILGGLSLLVGFAATAYASVRGAKDQANIRSWERAVQARDDEIAGLHLTVDRHERTILAHEGTIATHEATIEQQGRTIQELRSERPSAEEIAHIKRTLDAHDATMRRTVEEWKAKFDGFVERWEAEHGTA